MGCGSSKVGSSVITVNSQSATTTKPTKYTTPTTVETSDNNSVISWNSNEIENLEKYNTISKLTEGTAESFKIKRKKLIETLDILQDADQRALQASSSLRLSIEELTEYLIQPFRDSDLLKLRVLWRWITHNILYDVDAYFNPEDRNSGPIDAKDALNTGKAVCSGYASLLQVLSDVANLKVKTISGWAKGYSYQTGTNISEKDINHVWNVVYLSNSWWLLDPTWGTGYIDENQTFIQEYNEHYFLTDPKQFIFDHYPEDSSWQLIEPTLTIQQFESLPKFSKYFFQLAMRPVTHLTGIINSKTGKIHMKFKLDKDIKIDCIGKLIKKNDHTESDQYLHLYMTDKILHTLINLPYQGEYELKLYASIVKQQENNNGSGSSGLLKQQQENNNNGSGNSDPLSCICSYIIRCRKKAECERPSVYPKQFKKWSRGFYLHSPTEGELIVGKIYHFRISLPNVIEMAVCLGGKVSRWERLPNTEGKIWEGDILMVEGTERASVVVKLADQKNTTFTSLLAYKVVEKLE